MTDLTVQQVNYVNGTISNFAQTISGKRLLLAYSGGIDSHVLLYGMSRVYLAHEIDLIAVHFNHRLSPHSNLWQHHCQKVCDNLSIQLISHYWSGSEEISGGRENALRLARYEWFRSLMQEGDVVATGHQLDDQSETVLFRLFRGSGVRGLSAMAMSRTFGCGELHRPLLDVSRDQIFVTASYYELNWIEDESNSDESFDRNFIRKRIIPLIRSRWPNCLETIRRSSKQVASAEMLLNEIAVDDFGDKHQKADECRFTNFGKINISDIREMTLERSANLLRYWARQVHHEAPSSAQMLELLRQLTSASIHNNLRISWNTLEFRCYRDYVFLLPVQRGFGGKISQRVLGDEGMEILEAGVRLRILRTTGDGIREQDVNLNKIRVNGYSKNAKIQLQKNKKRRSLSNVYQELGIPPWERARIPVLSIDGFVIHVPGLGSTADLEADFGEPSVQFVLEEL